MPHVNLTILEKAAIPTTVKCGRAMYGVKFLNESCSLVDRWSNLGLIQN